MKQKEKEKKKKKKKKNLFVPKQTKMYQYQKYDNKIKTNKK